jgi:hypothetical protein
MCARYGSLALSLFLYAGSADKAVTGSLNQAAADGNPLRFFPFPVIFQRIFNRGDPVYAVYDPRFLMSWSLIDQMISHFVTQNRAVIE